MTRVKLLTDGGYIGLDACVGKTFQANKFLGHWNIDGKELLGADSKPILKEYLFLDREVEVVYAFC